jgi:hypothetical protein
MGMAGAQDIGDERNCPLKQRGETAEENRE